jgi:LysM repeat protein
LLIIALVITYIYRGYPFGQDKTVTTSTDTGGQVESKTILPAVKAASEAEAKPNLSELAQPTAEDNPRVAELISEAMSYLEAKPGGIIDARDRLNEALPTPMSGQQRSFVKAQLSELADKWLFSRTIFPQDKLCSSYKVKPGELLSTIGKQFKVPYEILMEINKIGRPEALQAGDTIKVINGPFHVRVYRSTFTMDLYLQNTFVRSFPVGLGKPGMETPTGLWVVKADGKMIAPTWTDPISGKTYESEDPDYPLGSRWIGLEGLKGDAAGRTGFAIHGTKKPNEIGIAGSQGCIRLHDDNVILVYNLLVPGDSRVEIME